MIARVKNAPKLRPQAEVAMANLVASLATSQALVVTANLDAMVAVTLAAKALRRAVPDWAMLLSAPNALLWSQLKTRCVAWLRKRTAKC
jgi:hypothetical protein